MKRCKRKKGFTLLELVVVIIVIGILSTLGLAQYGRMAEKSRGSEARLVLGSIRTGEEMWRAEYGGYTGVWGNIGIDAPTACLGQSSHFFSYTVSLAPSGNYLATATRCTAGGRAPTFANPNTIVLTGNIATNAVLWQGDGLGTIW